MKMKGALAGTKMAVSETRKRGLRKSGLERMGGAAQAHDRAGEAPVFPFFAHGNDLPRIAAFCDRYSGSYPVSKAFNGR